MTSTIILHAKITNEWTALIDYWLEENVGPFTEQFGFDSTLQGDWDHLRQFSKDLPPKIKAATYRGGRGWKYYRVYHGHGLDTKSICYVKIVDELLALQFKLTFSEQWESWPEN